MARIRLDVPGTLLDFLHRRTAVLNEQQGRGPRTGAKRQSPATAPCPAVLVENDQLFFRVLCRRPGAEARAVEDAFRCAFSAVWGALPERDQRRVLGYWRGGTDLPASGSPCPAPHARPLIRVVDAGRWSPSSPTCDGLGRRLAFPASLLSERPDLLPAVVARTLALVLRYATRSHWSLLLERIEHPFERWQRRWGKNADEASSAAKLGRLEADYL